MKILLTTLHAKYVHSSLALPYLTAACADLEDLDLQILELTVNEQQDQLLARLYAAKADVILFSCYIWNTELTLKLVSDLKQLAPGTVMVLGGPEVSFGAFELMAEHRGVDCIVRGEGDETCRELLQALRDGSSLEEIDGITYREGEEIIASRDRDGISNLDDIPSPFQAGLVDLKKPLVYYETSRGCPFSCAFCMSSIEGGVRSFSMERIRRDLGMLMREGVKTVKFVDRTFNFDAKRANEIWRLILAENRTSKYHFEISAELITEENLALLASVPAGLFQFEIGVQSSGEETLAAVSRKSSLETLFENVKRLKRETKVTVHLDLVAGLPGESLDGFLTSLEGLFSMNADHIQVEALKVMKGTAMRGIARKENYAFQESAPYKVLRTPDLSFSDIRRIEAISRLLELIYNSGRFATSLADLGATAPLSEIFDAAAAYFEANEIPYNLSLPSLFDAFWSFVQSKLEGAASERMRDALSFDFCLVGYPGGNAPSFFGPVSEKVGKWLPASLPAAKPGERIRYYRRTFARDYRVKPWAEGACEITFLYRSAPGEGLQVQII